MKALEIANRYEILRRCIYSQMQDWLLLAHKKQLQLDFPQKSGHRDKHE